MKDFFNKLLDKTSDILGVTDIRFRSEIVDFSRRFYQEFNANGISKPLQGCPSYHTMVASDEGFKSELALYLTHVVASRGSWNKDYLFTVFANTVLIALFKSADIASDESLIAICRKVYYSSEPHGDKHHYFPYAHFLTHVDKYLASHPLNEELEKALRLLRRSAGYIGKEDLQFNQRLEKVLSTHKNEPFNIELFVFVNDDTGRAIREFVQAQEAKSYFKELTELLLVEAFDKTTPTQKWEKRAAALVAHVDKAALAKWIGQLAGIVGAHIEACHKIPNLWRHDFPYKSIQTYSMSNQWFSLQNEAVVRRAVWLLPYLCEQEELIAQISDLGLLAFKKYPEIGPLLSSVGHACMYALSRLPAHTGIPLLTKYNQKINNQSVKKTIEKYLKAIAAQSGKTREEMEEESVPAYGFGPDHTQTVVFGDCTATLSLQDPAKIRIVWQNAEGKTFKSAPAGLKDRFSDNLKALNAQIKLIQEQLVLQAKRIEEIYLSERRWSFDQWTKVYNETGILAFLGQKIIWIFESDERRQAGMFHEGRIVDSEDRPLLFDSEKTTVRLWHPILSSMQEVSAWRDFIFRRRLTQPFKQAYREVYILTDAEINTGVYSNRFAGHVLKNFQFAALCKARNWSGYNPYHYSGETARKTLQYHNLQAEYWLQHTNVEQYVTTDQVCFLRQGARINLAQTPPLIFSEIMRDVDMFVAVCSVGSDPEWRDTGGEGRYDRYWHSYSFGDLGESAKMRKAILEKILPKLKIASVTRLEDKFLVVKGKIRTYKIHLGSANILMSPNDQYLCIVPDRAKPKDEGLYLPFEGDGGLSVIISKAFLLADDDKIKDSTIVSQISTFNT